MYGNWWISHLLDDLFYPLWGYMGIRGWENLSLLAMKCVLAIGLSAVPLQAISTVLENRATWRILGCRSYDSALVSTPQSCVSSKNSPTTLVLVDFQGFVLQRWFFCCSIWEIVSHIHVRHEWNLITFPRLYLESPRCLFKRTSSPCQFPIL